MIIRIAFIGATGQLGKPVARELINAGFEVTALVRDEARARAALPENIRLLQGDLRSLRDVKKLFAGQDAVYLNLNLNLSDRNTKWLAEREGMDTIIEAAQECKIKRIAFLSSVIMNYQRVDGFQWWVFDVKKYAVDLLKSSGIPYTIFYPSTFMDNFNGTYRRGNKILLAGKSLHKMYFIAAEDYGRQVVKSFQILDGENKEYVVQGTEGFTADEAARVFIDHYKKEKLGVSRAPLGLLKFLGNFSPTISYGYHIVYALNHYAEKFEAQKTWDELGKPGVTLEAFAGR